jgi:3-dehydroquinate synthase
MTCAARLARRIGLVDDRFCEAQQSLLSRLGLPTEVPLQSHVGMVSAMMLDKKNRVGQLRLVLPKRLGQVELVADVSPAQALAALSDDSPATEKTV